MTAEPFTARRPWTRIVSKVAIAAVALTVLAGCAAGQHAGTVEQTPVVDGVSANVGSINLRAVSVAAPENGSYAKGGNADLQLFLVNNSTADDQLVGVSTSVATSTALYTDAAAATGSSSGESSSATVTPSDTSSASASATASASESTSAAATEQSLPLPAGKLVSVGHGDSDPVIALQGLTTALFPAQSFQITLTFATAGTVTFTVAVHLAKPPSSPATGATRASTDEG